MTLAHAIKAGTNQSIHPRVVNGRTLFPKRNTCHGGRQAHVIARVVSGLEKHLAEHPNDRVSAAHLAKLTNPGAAR